MLDNISFKAPIRPYTSDALNRFDQIAFYRNSTVKIKETTNYLQSPVTDAQFEVLPTIEDIAGRPWLILSFKIPVAAAFAGQNLFHAGLEAIESELKVVRKLAQWTLRSYQFQDEEIGFYLKGVKAVSCELTWHTSTASLSAAKKVQARTIAHFTALEQIKSRQDVFVQDVNVMTVNGCTSLLVTFKDGSQFRQYIKIEQARSRTRNKRRSGFVSAEMRAHLPTIYSAIGTHVRNEVIASPNLLKELGLLKFRDWKPRALSGVIGAVMAMARLDRRRVTKFSDLDTSGLSPEVIATANAYFAGQDINAGMSDQLFAKHRKKLLAKDVDIADTLANSRNKLTASGGLQLLYAKRWVPEPDLVQFAVNADSVGRIIDALNSAPLADRTFVVASQHEGSE